ncbi:hypothetical protein [Flavobacterium sp. ZB4P13]|uniref:hypothetical protein n=1 Tax=Flavobacterium sp. ZB4P13 TaxID=3401728 RepID=UPI003AAB5BA9
MKTFIITLLLVSFTNATYSQNNILSDFENGNLETEGFPGMVIKTDGKVSYVYLTDKHPDAAVRELQKKFVEYSIQKNNGENPIYRLYLEIEKGTIVAYYNEDQKLISVDEKYKNVKLPTIVMHSILKEHPGWAVKDDTYFYS